MLRRWHQRSATFRTDRADKTERLPGALDALIIDDTLNAAQLAQLLVGSGVTVSNALLMGAAGSAGSFTGGADILGLGAGIVLGSGAVMDVIGPNQSDATTTSWSTPGDSDLDDLIPQDTHDAAVLEFDFVPDADVIQVRYVFASEEYNEYVNSSYNDVFAFFVNGVNCATVGDPAVPVSINNINNGNPFGDGGPNAATLSEQRPQRWRRRHRHRDGRAHGGADVHSACECRRRQPHEAGDRGCWRL